MSRKRVYYSVPDIIKICNEKFGDRFLYTHLNQESSFRRKDRITFYCREHGDFSTTLENHCLKPHTQGGCFPCGREKTSASKAKTEEHIKEKIKQLHGNTYDYLGCDFSSGLIKKTTITCKIHGDFQQALRKHLEGQGCKKCASYKQSLREKARERVYETSLRQFLQRMKPDIMNKYKYFLDLETKIGYKDIITIECPVHGLFEKSIVEFIKCGCGLCRTKSHSEVMIEEFLNLRGIGGRALKFDFYLPNSNTIIEYDGKQHFQPVSYWGGEENFRRLYQNDLIKNKYCEDNNINIIRIRYDEDLPKRLEEIASQLTLSL